MHRWEALAKVGLRWRAQDRKAWRGEDGGWQGDGERWQPEEDLCFIFACLALYFLPSTQEHVRLVRRPEVAFPLSIS